MIVRQAGTGLLLITQPDHAQLAGRIMRHCVALADHSRRGAILRAIAEHDNGWAEEDAAPLADPAGGVVDFVAAPLAVRHRVWPRAVERLADDPWAAALVAQHAITVYDRFRPDPAWTPFFARMEALRDRMTQSVAQACATGSGAAAADLRDDYAFVRLGDLVSLTFCTGWTDAQRYADWTVRLSGDRVRVAPDPFGGAVIPIEIAAREIPARPFRTDAGLRDALGRASATVLRGAASG